MQLIKLKPQVVITCIACSLALILTACGGGNADVPVTIANPPSSDSSTNASVNTISSETAEFDKVLSQAAAAAAVNYRGVSLASAEFGADAWGNGTLPGTYNSTYIYPNQTEVDYFLRKKMNIVRLPFRWERLQPRLNNAFDSTELGRLDAFISAATSKGMNVIIDPHNYARWYTNVLGSSALPNSALADFWSRLATKYKSNSRVIFALMNEPHDMATEAWLSAANAAIAAIRAAGATNLILVPGNGYTGAKSWTENWYGTSNATVMLGVKDSGNNYMYEVHQYLDSNSSGNSDQCVSATIGVERLTAFTNWLKTNGKRAFLGEFAGGNNSICRQAITNMLDHLQSNSDVWKGWTWWAAGPWWGSYMYTLEPNGSTDAAQMSWLTPFLP